MNIYNYILSSDSEWKTKCVIAIEDWQFQCCGTDFKVGDTVEWLIHEWGNNVAPRNGADYYYEHHSSDWQELFKVAGIVDKISIEYFNRELRSPTEKYPKGYYESVYQMTVDVESSDEANDEIDGFSLGSYVVALRDYIILPAKQDEVTYS